MDTRNTEQGGPWRRQEWRRIRLTELIPNRQWPMVPPEDGDMDELRAAIEMTGFIAPPFVIASDDGRYEVLDGHARIEVAKQLGREELTCVVLLDTEGFDPGRYYLRHVIDQTDPAVQQYHRDKETAILKRQFEK